MRANFFELPQSGVMGTLDPATIEGTLGGMLDLAQLSNKVPEEPGVFVFKVRRPVVTIAPTENLRTNDDPIAFTITFDEPVSGFTLADLSATGGTLGALTTVTAGTVYMVNVVPAADGNVALTVALNAATNSAGNGNLAVTRTVISDKTPPQVVSITPSGTTVHTVNVPFTVTFNEAVAGIGINDFTSSNGSPISVTGTGITRVVTVASAQDGAMTLTVVPVGIFDIAGNTLGTTGPMTASVTVDTTGPNLIVNAPIEITNAATPVTVSFDFSSPVTGFTATDVAVSRGTRGTLVTVNPSQYTMDVTPTGTGLVRISVPFGAAVDADGLSNYAAADAFIYDTVDPTVVVSATASSFSEPTPVIFTFSEPIIGFDAADITVTGGSAGAPALVAGTTATWRAVITPSADPVTVSVVTGLGVTVTDIAGNVLASSNTLTLDFDDDATLSPLTMVATVANVPATEPVTGPFVVTFTFAGPATGFSAADIIVVNGSDSGFTIDDPNSYSTTITPGGVGLVTVRVAANAATVGGAGNESATLSINHRPNGPRPTFRMDPSTSRAGQSVTVTVTFDEPVTGFDLSGVTVTGGTASMLTAIAFSNDTTYEIVIALDPRPNTSAVLTLQAGAADGANARDSQAASFNLLRASSSGGSRSQSCGLGSGISFLLLSLMFGLSLHSGGWRKPR